MRYTDLVLGLFLLCGGCGDLKEGGGEFDDDADSDSDGGGDYGGDGGGTSGDGGSSGGSGGGICVSDSWWNGGNDESPRMHPGMDCIGCHRDMDDGPTYTVAGTVFTDYDEPDDCNGRQGVVVEVTDANGDVWRETTNSAGNFFFRDGSVQYPITARVIDGSDVREMVTEVSTGNCATCHTADGEQGAGGRVVAP
jgi:hypothetical protein